LRIVLGVTGGIAAYKATAIIRQLTAAGHSVQVVATENALRFIGATTLEALSHHAVDSNLYTDVASVKHVEIGQNADLIIVAPATASFLARYAAGIADDLLGNTLLATKAPVLVAPAMHTEMWQHASTVANVATLRSRGISVLDSAAFELVHPLDLVGRHIVVTAGGTQEAIDPVRFIGNKSSGKQGLAIARAAKARGARVCLIGANIPDFSNEFDEFVSIVTASEMQIEVDNRLATADVLVMAAAVSDFRVAAVSETKIKRSEVGDRVTLELIANPDILKGAVARVSAEGLGTITVGFAAETAGTQDQLLKLAETKLAGKGCDILVANDVSGGDVFGKDTNSVIVVSRGGASDYVQGSKDRVAQRIVDLVASTLND
jgi:phosphopantothenoylcysteine decarboxylase / phosphopantothenate---cysteine ligase